MNQQSRYNVNGVDDCNIKQYDSTTWNFMCFTLSQFSDIIAYLSIKYHDKLLHDLMEFFSSLLFTKQHIKWD